MCYVVSLAEFTVQSRLHKHYEVLSLPDWTGTQSRNEIPGRDAKEERLCFSMLEIFLSKEP